MMSKDVEMESLVVEASQTVANCNCTTPAHDNA